MRQTAKDGLHLARPRPSADHAIGDGVAQDSRQDDPHQPRKESRRERQDEPLVGVEPVGGGLRDANLRDGTVELAKHSLSRRVRPQHRANRVLRRTGVERGADGAYSRTRRRAARRESRVVEKLCENGLASELHHAHHARRQLSPERIAEHRGQIDEYAHRRLRVERDARGGVAYGSADRGGEPGAEEPEGLQAHRREWIEHSLRDIRREVHAQVVLVLRRSRRDGIERRDVARLHDPELPVFVDGPLDVLRAAEVLLDTCPESGDLVQLRVAEDVAAALEHRARSGFDDEVLGIHGARHELLAETPNRFDHCALAASGDGVGGEEHARALGIDHSLHDHREPEAARREIVSLAIRDGAVIPERCPALADRVEDGVLSSDAEDGVLLACEARVGQVLGRRRRTHRDRRRAERPVRVADRIGDPCGDGRRGETHARGRGRFSGHTGGLSGERVRRGRDDEPVRHWKLSAPQLAEVGALTSGLRQIHGGQLIERPNEHQPMLGRIETSAAPERHSV